MTPTERARMERAFDRVERLEHAILTHRLAVERATGRAFGFQNPDRLPLPKTQTVESVKRDTADRALWRVL